MYACVCMNVYVCLSVCVHVWAFRHSGVCLRGIVSVYKLSLRAYSCIYIAILDITSIMILFNMQFHIVHEAV